MTHAGYVVKVKNVRPHPNADRLQIATFFTNDVCIGIDVPIGELGIYFPSDLQLSAEYCAENHLCRKKADGSPDTGYMDPNKRNIKAIRLRGERSDGIYMAISSLEYTGANLDDFKEGDTITIVNGHPICNKYIPKRPNRESRLEGNRVRKKKVPIAPLFKEHADTEQLAYNLSAFRPGDQIEITLKMHGTSQRTGYLPVLTGYKRTLLNRILRREGTPQYDWGYVSGTRRVVLENYDGGFYGSNEFREVHSKKFEGKLWKGETVYYEVVSFTNNGTPIMGTGKVPKDYKNIYGDTMIFHYGRTEGSDMYVYRMTYTTEDGNVIEYSPDFMRYRCEQMGIKCVPVFWKGYIPENIENAGDWIIKKAEEFYEGPDPIGKTHEREGVVVRIVNKPKFCAYKHKGFLFKLISGIIKEQDVNQNVSDDILSEM